MAELLEQAKEKWGADISLETLKITPEHIHCYCLGYDRYDSSDYVDYLLIEKTA